MKKVFAIILSMLLFVALSFAVVGCKKAEEQKPAEPAKTAPAPAPAPAGTTTTTTTAPAPAGTSTTTTTPAAK